MSDKTKAQLIAENQELRQRVAILESFDTSRRRAQEELRHEHQHAQQYLDVAGVIMVVLDNTGNVRLLNRKGYAILGYGDGDLLGMNWFDTCVPQRIHDEVKSTFRELIAGRLASSEYHDNPVITKSGEERIIAWHNVILTDDAGAVVGTLSSGLDITERKRTEEALRESEQWACHLLETIPLGAAECTTDGVITRVNPAYERMLGYSRHELVGKNVADLLEPGSQRQAFLDYLKQLVLEQPTPTVYLCRDVRKDGQPIDVQVDWTYKRNGQGEVTGFVSILSDITERKRAEEALQEAHDELERRVEERTAELRRSKSWLEEAQRIARIGNWEWDAKTNEVIWSDEMYRIFGVSKDTFPVSFEEHLKLIPAEDREEYVVGLDRVVAEKGRWNREHRILLPDGSIRYVWAIGTERTDAEGNMIGLSGTTQDITERKRMEEALTQSERRFRNYFEQGLIGMAMTSVDKRWLEVNDRLCEIMGHSREELLQSNWADLTHPDDLEPNLQLFNRLLAGEIEHYTLDKRFFRKDGSIVYTTIHIRAFRKEDGSIDYIVALTEDITARKQAEEALRQSEERYRAVVEDQTEVISRFKADGTFIFLNDVWCRFFGKTNQELLGKRWQPEPVPEDVPLIEEQLRSLSPSNPVVVIENRVCSGLGEVRWMQFVNRGFFDPSGRLTEIQCVGRDITDRKQAQEALRQSHDQLQMIYDEMIEGLLITDIETKRFVRVNSSMCRMLGYSEEELLAASINDIHPSEEVPNDLHRFQTVAEGRRTINEDRPVLTKNGRIFYADITGRPIVYGGRPCVLALFRDVTERKRAQQALAASENKYRQLVETTGTGYLILDGQGRVIDANAEYIRISGHRTLADILGRTVVEWTAPYDVDRNAKEVEKCFRQGFVWQLEIDYVHPNGKIIPIEVNATCIDTEDGRRIVSLCRDISERRQAQAALERERQSLWHMLQASDHERQIISYEIHDGLAQYLAAANMQFQVFDHLRDSNPEEAKKAHDAAIQLVSQSHGEARRLISGVRPPVLDEAGLETAIAHLVHDRRAFKGPKIKFDSDVQFGRLPSIFENSLYRIAQEALTNACKHSNSQEVKVTLAQEGQEVRLGVRDWGIGFAPESVAKGHFGLEGIRQRVRLLGGRLNIESRPGFGTLVQIVVPIVQKQSEG